MTNMMMQSTTTTMLAVMLLLSPFLFQLGESFGWVSSLAVPRISTEPVGGRKQQRAASTELFSSPQSSSPSSKAKRKKSKMKKTTAGKSLARKGGSGSPLTEMELADHVSDEYINGPGGMMRDFERKRKRFENTYASTQVQSMAARQQEETVIQGMLMDATTTTVSEETTQEVIRNLDRHPALVLNADYLPLSYLPLSLWHWQEAVKAVFNGKVTVVDVYPDVAIRAANLQVPLPSVIALTEYVSPKHLNHKPAFTKRNVFLRDEYRCQYCNEFFHTRDLSLDHVVPRCRGGQLSWDNAVTSCTKCNGRKGSMGLKEIRSKWGMVLRNEPRCPTQYELAVTASKMLPRQVHPTWEPYLPYHQQKKKKSGNASYRYQSEDEAST
mmetsp:Transcript_27298/g.63935  ORF Transcript_27298/g.63935 Transcript_27298/m.63935 type:complete len:383 (+) Transcript_27298:227-1375(+)